MYQVQLTSSNKEVELLNQQFSSVSQEKEAIQDQNTASLAQLQSTAAKLKEEATLKDKELSSLKEVSLFCSYIVTCLHH